MPVQILLHGRVFGSEQFLLAGTGEELDFAGRIQWLSLLTEVLPRGILAELALPKVLLGSSGGEQFLMILPEESKARAEELLTAAQAAIRGASSGALTLLWSTTENLGDWTVVRRRLNEEMQRKLGTPLANYGAPADAGSADPGYFAQLGEELRHAETVGWTPDAPARIVAGSGKHTWPVGSGADAIPLARHAALTDDGNSVASPAVIAQRAAGRPVWGVLRGDVDDFLIRLRRLTSIEEHVQVSVLYKQFFAGELEVLASLPDFFRRVTVLHCGGDDFAVLGSWDALIAFALELRRMFNRFSEQNLRDYPGQEGKTITMALALAPDNGARVDSIFESAGEKLAIAKAADKDCFYLLGRVLEWKQVGDAAGLKDQLTRMISDFGAAPEYIHELCAIYRETKRTGGGARSRPERPWRFHRRLNRILGAPRTREHQKARTSLVGDLAGRNPANLKLRPSGRVALEWARLASDAEKD